MYGAFTTTLQRHARRTVTRALGAGGGGRGRARATVFPEKIPYRTRRSSPELFAIKDHGACSGAAERDAARVVIVRAHEWHERPQPPPPALVLLPVDDDGGQRAAINCRSK